MAEHFLVGKNIYLFRKGNTLEVLFSVVIHGSAPLLGCTFFTERRKTKERDKKGVKREEVVAK